MAKYKQIEGNLKIMKNGKIFVGKFKMLDDEIVHLPIKTLKQIILDAKKDVI